MGYDVNKKITQFHLGELILTTKKSILHWIQRRVQLFYCLIKKEKKTKKERERKSNNKRGKMENVEDIFLLYFINNHYYSVIKVHVVTCI